MDKENWKMNNISSNTQRKAGIALSYLHTALSAIISVIYIPILLHSIGQSEYGLYQLMGSVIAYFSTAYSSLNSSVMKYYTEYLISGDRKKMENTLALSQRVFRAISVLLIILSIPVGILYKSAYREALSPAEMKESIVMFIIMIVNILVYLNNSIYSAAIMSHERFIFRRAIDVIAQVLQPIAVVLFIQKYPYAITIVVVQLILNCVIAVSNIIYSKKRLFIKVVYHENDSKLVRGLLSLSGSVLFVSLADQIFWKTDQLILGQLYGTEVVAVYSIGAQLCSIYISCGIVMSSVLLPMLTKVINEDVEGKKLSKIFAQLGRYQSFVVMLAMSGIVLFGKEFVVILAGEEYIDGYIVALLLMLPYTVDLIQNSGNTILQAKNQYWFRARILFAAAVINIIMTYFMAGKFGMYGAAMATTVTIIITSWGIMNYIYSEKVKLNVKLFWKEVVPVWVLGICPFLFGVMIREIKVENLFLQFAIHVILYVFVYSAFLWNIIMRPSEKKYLMGGFTNKR